MPDAYAWHCGSAKARLNHIFVTVDERVWKMMLDLGLPTFLFLYDARPTELAL